jgi:tetratricopeptide (TPR) repeat protein
VNFFGEIKANWGLIARGVPFERDLEEEVYDSLLDYATSSAKRPLASSVLAPAGYGTTTFIRTLAARLVKDRAGVVLMHKEGTPLIQGDIEFAASIFPDSCPFFLIDNAADYEPVAFESLQRLRDLERPAFFLLAERLNEWRFRRRGRAPGREFMIEALSDPEIRRLLECLESQHENNLADLSDELRFAAVKQSYQQELLVTPREATEGKAFDAILEDEFRSIPTPLARRLYLIVCCFYQHGALVRDSLLAELLHVPLTEMYKHTSDATTGITIFDEIDPSYGRYAARARHRKIATVVWERCVTPGEQEAIVVDALSGMNLNYPADVKAFEDFIRSDRLVDSIRTLDGRTRFFEQACQKDPLSPYVRQHFARMLARSKQFNLALGQIEEGLKLNPNIRVLHHTKGMILQQLAMAGESIEIARRRLVQSEEEFELCISANDRDEYAYQGLASLYVDWAERVPDPAESADYLSKAEGVISEGLRRVQVRDGLWIVSSRIQDIFGNKPGYMAALTKAAAETKGGVIAKYLLARAFRESGDPKRAIDILEPVIAAHTDEFRACVECASAMANVGEPYTKCIALLRLSTLYGLSDPRFVATFGGMLFLNGDFTEAKEVFAESRKRDFPADEAIRIQFRPKNRSDLREPLRLVGSVTAVKVGYAFINAIGYPSFFCPGSKFGRIVMSEGLRVTFDAVFTSKGQAADNVQLATA